MDLLDPRLVGLSLTTAQAYAFFFLLGSFTVASLSDLKHLAAQREFVEVWLAFTGVFFLLELVDLDFEPDTLFVAKWALLLLVSVLSLDRVGVLFRLAWADVAAMAAAMSLLSPALILLFALALKLASWPLARLTLRRGGFYPFLPVVTVATLAVLAFGFLLD